MKLPLESAKVDDTLAQIAEQARGAGIIEPDSLIDGATPDEWIDVLEMQIRDALAVPAIKRHGIEARVFAVSGVQAHTQQLGPDGIEHGLELVLEFDEAGRMRVHRHLESEFLSAHSGHRPDAVEKSGELRTAQTLRLIAAAGRGRTPRGDRID